MSLTRYCDCCEKEIPVGTNEHDWNGHVVSKKHMNKLNSMLLIYFFPIIFRSDYKNDLIIIDLLRVNMNRCASESHASRRDFDGEKRQ